MNLEYNGLESDKLFLNVVDKTTRDSIVCVPNISYNKMVYNVSPEFKSLLQITIPWLKLVRREIDAEKRYSELLNPKNYIPFEEISNQDEMFSKEEVAALKTQAQKLIQHLKTLGLNEHQANELKEHITKTVEKAHSQSKNDGRICLLA